MNKVITINLGGNAYQLEDGGYDALRSYLESAALRLEGNPDKGEILADIERAIAEKCRAVLGAHKTVVSTKEIETIIAEMGPVESGSEEAEGSPAGSGPSSPKNADEDEHRGPPRRLYRIKEGQMIAGVCNGLAAYFGCDPTIVRLLFVFVGLITFGAAVVAYLVMMVVVPPAATAAEKAAAFGGPSTAQDFIRRAREGYYEGMRTFGDRRAHREWKRRFKREMRDWKRDFKDEWRDNAREWRRQWGSWQRNHPWAHGAFWVASPLISILAAIVTFVWIIALLSLIFTGAVFGVFHLAGLPLWFGIVALTLAYGLLIWPLKAARHAYWDGARWVHHAEGPSLFWLAVLALCLWYGNRHYPRVHHALMDLPPAIHRSVDSLRQWWSRH